MTKRFSHVEIANLSERIMEEVKSIQVQGQQTQMSFRKTTQPTFKEIAIVEDK